ncbi:hypothetical protein DFH09DRAFT_1299980 [Mycena vulgaris]|nr:hypothetical protein DFH09DRAFT_1299980 [Mycena vulgaris]
MRSPHRPRRAPPYPHASLTTSPAASPRVQALGISHTCSAYCSRRAPPPHLHVPRSAASLRVRGHEASPHAPAPPMPRSSSPPSARLAHDIPRGIAASMGTWYLPVPPTPRSSSPSVRTSLRRIAASTGTRSFPARPRTAHASLLLPIWACFAHDIPRGIAASTGTWYLPARAPRTAHTTFLLPICARLTLPHRREYGDTKPPRTLLVPPRLRSSSPSVCASLTTSPAASPQVWGQDMVPPRTRSPQRWRRALLTISQPPSSMPTKSTPTSAIHGAGALGEGGASKGQARGVSEHKEFAAVSLRATGT